MLNDRFTAGPELVKNGTLENANEWSFNEFQLWQAVKRLECTLMSWLIFKRNMKSE